MRARKGLVPHCLLESAVIPDLGVRLLNWGEAVMVALISQILVQGINIYMATFSNSDIVLTLV